MTRVSIHPHEAFHPGNEAAAFDASATPGEIFYHSSVLGKALYGTIKALGIAAYPYSGAVVLEGCTEEIDERRESLVNRLAPEIAARALQPPYWKSSSKPSHNELTDMVKTFGAPIQNQKGDNSFHGRMARSVGRFADYTSDDNVIYRHNTPYTPPLDRRIYEILDTVRRGGEEVSISIEEPSELLKRVHELSKIDRLTPEQEVVAALGFYLNERGRDPSFKLRRYLQNISK